MAVTNKNILIPSFTFIDVVTFISVFPPFLLPSFSFYQKRKVLFKQKCTVSINHLC